MQRRCIAAIATVLFAISMLFACIDLTPIEVTRAALDASAPDVLALDASDAGRDVDLRPPCLICVEDEAGVCAADYAACHADPQCDAILVCAAALGCLDRPTAQAVVGCGLPCAAEAGLRSQFDPPAQEILALIVCSQQACSTECPWARDH